MAAAAYSATRQYLNAVQKAGSKDPDKVIKALADLQAHMLMDPELGGTKGLPDLIRAVNRITHYNDPRWLGTPEDPQLVGGLMFLFMMASPVQGALLEYLDTDETTANLVFYYKDYQGKTIRRAIEMVREWKERPENQVDGFTVKLAGGTIGVKAAINESAFESNVIIIPLVFALIFLSVSGFYASLHAGLIMLAISLVAQFVLLVLFAADPATVFGAPVRYGPPIEPVPR